MQACSALGSSEAPASFCACSAALTQIWLQVGFQNFLAKCENLQFDGETGRPGGRVSARDMQRLKGPHQLADKYLTLPISELDVSEWEVSHADSSKCERVLHEGRRDLRGPHQLAEKQLTLPISEL